MRETDIAFEIETPLAFDAVVARAREALSTEGFGVITEIDVQATMKKKLGVDVPPYLILGACNPPAAHAALSAVPAVGVLLPCNVTVSVEGERTVVRAMNPRMMRRLFPDPRVEVLAQDIAARLCRVLETCAG